MPTKPMPFGVAELCDRGLEACPVRGCVETSNCRTHGIKVHATRGGFTYVYDDPLRNLLWTEADDQERLNAILRGKRESRNPPTRISPTVPHTSPNAATIGCTKGTEG